MDSILDNLLEETAPLKRYFTEQEYYDRVKKFELYKEITTLKQYVLVDSVQKYKSESFTLSGPGQWGGNSITNESDKIYFPSINYYLSLKDIYNGVDF